MTEAFWWYRLRKWVHTRRCAVTMNELIAVLIAGVVLLILLRVIGGET